MGQKLTDGEKTMALVLALDGGQLPLTHFDAFINRPSKVTKAAHGLVAKGLASASVNFVTVSLDYAALSDFLRIKKPAELFQVAPGGQMVARAGSAPKKISNQNVPGRSEMKNSASSDERFAKTSLRLNGAPVAVSLSPESLSSSAKKSNGNGLYLQSLRSSASGPTKAKLDPPVHACDAPPEGRDGQRGLRALKERHKGIKPLTGLEDLKSALATVESCSDEMEVYAAMCGILGGVVMEGGDLDRRGVERFGDGGKWLNRWRISRQRVHRCLAELIIQIAEEKVKSRGGKAESLWTEIFGKT